MKNANNHLRNGNGKYHQGRGGVFVAKRSRPELHKCLVPGCEYQIRVSMLMCPDHWRQVPRHIQEAVGVAWEESKYFPGDRRVIESYSAARRAAVEAVKEREAIA